MVTPYADEIKRSTKEIVFGTTTYAIDYSSDWTADEQKDKTSHGGALVISNPAGTVEADFSVTSGRLGSAWDPKKKSDYKVRRYNVGSKVNTKLASGVNLHLVETIVDNPGVYSYKVGLWPDEKLSAVQADDSACKVDYLGVVSNATTNDKDLATEPTIIANIIFPKLPETQSAIQRIEHKFSTKDYQKAVDALLPARKK